ncbi:hypothetical protein AMATHDRAFT_70772 [Amanita thiersii Skay4041]|uniref:Uncharacterized protein n=1 Tax=Amanita thiersii Skay4041 TaxID=703135 RepID=A0A2A9NCK1_9AGAR|nr:hypothetical protein AMATHDRAFT_70772 [Amanita thiersii Skay4041]
MNSQKYEMKSNEEPGGRHSVTYLISPSHLLLGYTPGHRILHLVVPARTMVVSFRVPVSFRKG